jgi:hypothetical protein
LLLLLLILVVAAVALRDGELFGGSASDLDNTFTSRSGVSFVYPSGWMLNEIEGTVIVGNNAQALLPGEPQPGTFAATIYPPYPRTLLPDPNMSLDDALETILEVRNPVPSATHGEAESTSVDGIAAARTTLTGPTSEGIALALEPVSGTLVLLYAIGSPGTLAEYEDEVMGIAESIQYTPPES